MSKEESSEEAQGGAAAGGETPKKDLNADIYENRGSKKIIRLITVMAYMFSVSFVAIVLSAYYLFLWEPPNPRLLRRPVHLSSEPEVQFLLSDPPDEQNVSNEPSYKLFSARIVNDGSETNSLTKDHYYEREQHRDRLNESLFLLRNSLVEFVRNRINDSKSDRNSSRKSWGIFNFPSYTSLQKEETSSSTKNLGEGNAKFGARSRNVRNETKDEKRHPLKMMNRIFDNNGTFLILNSSTISGDEVNNDRFTSTRNNSMYASSQNVFRPNRGLTENAIVAREQSERSVLTVFNAKIKTVANSEGIKVKKEDAIENASENFSNIEVPRNSKKYSSNRILINSAATTTIDKPDIIIMTSDKEDPKIEESGEDLAYSIGWPANSHSALDSSHNVELADHLKYLQRSSRSSANSANAAMNFKETQIEKMTTKSMTGENEKTQSPEITTTQRQKDLLTILIEINDTSSSASPQTVSEHLQTDPTTESKETSTGKHSKIT